MIRDIRGARSISARRSVHRYVRNRSVCEIEYFSIVSKCKKCLLSLRIRNVESYENQSGKEIMKRGAIYF